MSDTGLSAPNYTQTPNTLFDEWLPLMSNSELRVTLVIIRKTFGWHKRRDAISLTQLEALTGLSRQGVIDGVAQGEARGTIRATKGRPNTYELIVNDVDQSSVEESTTLTQIVNVVDTQKKEKENKREKKAAPPAFKPDYSRFLGG